MTTLFALSLDLSQAISGEPSKSTNLNMTSSSSQTTWPRATISGSISDCRTREPAGPTDSTSSTYWSLTVCTITECSHWCTLKKKYKNLERAGSELAKTFVIIKIRSRKSRQVTTTHWRSAFSLNMTTIRYTLLTVIHIHTRIYRDILPSSKMTLKLKTDFEERCSARRMLVIL